MGLELSIEPGRVTDAKALSAIAQSTFELACPADSDKSEIAKYIAENLSEPQFKQMLLSDETPVFCAWANSSIVGFLILRAFESSALPTQHSRIPLNWKGFMFRLIFTVPGLQTC